MNWGKELSRLVSVWSHREALECKLYTIWSYLEARRLDFYIHVRFLGTQEWEVEGHNFPSTEPIVLWGKFSRECGSCEQLASNIHNSWKMGVYTNREGNNRAPTTSTKDS